MFNLKETENAHLVFAIGTGKQKKTDEASNELEYTVAINDRVERLV